MHQNLDDIAELAEDLGNRFLIKGKVNLERIARSENISFIKGNYGNHFLGQLVHYSEQFYIILNNDLLGKSESGRIRFTIAHELGHYFIDAHRSKLSKGISLSFKEELNESESKKTEIAANHFAANLLMPKLHFVKLAQKSDYGLSGIFTLKTKYDTSIESTVKHYININLNPCIMLKWKSDCTFHYAWCSSKFSELLQLKRFPIPIRFDANYIKEQIKIIDEYNYEYIESATPVSRWISIITPRSPQDILGLEQTIKIGDFGGITLLTFQQ